MMLIILSTTAVIDNTRHHFITITTKKFLIHTCHLQTFPLSKLSVKFRLNLNLIFYQLPGGNLTTMPLFSDINNISTKQKIKSMWKILVPTQTDKPAACKQPVICQ